MKLLLILLLLVTGGCATTYEVSKCTADGVCVTAKVRTYREFTDGAKVHYEDGKFTFEAGSVTTATSPLEEAAADAIRTLSILAAPSSVE